MLDEILGEGGERVCRQHLDPGARQTAIATDQADHDHRGAEDSHWRLIAEIGDMLEQAHRQALLMREHRLGHRLVGLDDRRRGVRRLRHGARRVIRENGRADRGHRRRAHRRRTDRHR